MRAVILQVREAVSTYVLHPTVFLILLLLLGCASQEHDHEPTDQGCIDDRCDPALEMALLPDQEAFDQQTDQRLEDQGPVADLLIRADSQADDGPVFNDQDGDGIEDSVDLCPMVPDPAQGDQDQDLIGDLCDSEPDRAQLRLTGRLVEGAGTLQGTSNTGEGIWLSGALSPGGGNSQNGAIKLRGALSF